MNQLVDLIKEMRVNPYSLSKEDRKRLRVMAMSYDENKEVCWKITAARAMYTLLKGYV